MTFCNDNTVLDLFASIKKWRKGFSSGSVKFSIDLVQNLSVQIKLKWIRSVDIDLEDLL